MEMAHQRNQDKHTKKVKAKYITETVWYEYSLKYRDWSVLSEAQAMTTIEHHNMKKIDDNNYIDSQETFMIFSKKRRVKIYEVK